MSTPGHSELTQGSARFHSLLRQLEVDYLTRPSAHPLSGRKQISIVTVVVERVDVSCRHDGRRRIT
jgi:hypothetical protein